MKKLSFAKKALIICVFAIVFVFAGCIIALAVDDSMRTQCVPENTMLDERVDISNMTEAELRQLIVDRVDNNLATSVCVSAKDTAFEFDMSDIGSIDIDKTVNQAFSPYGNDFFGRVYDRLSELVTHKKTSHSVSIACAVDSERLASRVDEMAKSVNSESRSAAYFYDDAARGLAVTPAQEGFELDCAQTIAAIEKAVTDAASDEANRLVIQAQGTVIDAGCTDPGQSIFVDTRKCKVKLYEGGAEVISYDCTPGASGYETPTGDFYLWYKDPAPTWINPHSDWSKDMEETIAPGPTNPLGVRALAVSCGGGIFIHGTTNLGALGSTGSHGCVRLSNDNIVQLYDRVSEDIPIIIR